MPHYIQTKPFVVPTTDGKLIEEHVGYSSAGESAHSIARMVAPPGWAEPFQQPMFDEYILVNKGKKQFEVDGETVVLTAGQSMLIKAGSRVRYSNPFEEPCEYWSICIPAFSMETVNRDVDQ